MRSKERKKGKLLFQKALLRRKAIGSYWVLFSVSVFSVNEIFEHYLWDKGKKETKAQERERGYRYHMRRKWDSKRENDQEYNRSYYYSINYLRRWLPHNWKYISIKLRIFAISISLWPYKKKGGFFLRAHEEISLL